MSNEINNLQTELEQQPVQEPAETVQEVAEELAPEVEAQAEVEAEGTAQPTSVEQPNPFALLKVATTGRDMLFAVLFFVVGIIWADFALYGGFQLGYTIAAGALGVLTLIYPTAEHRLSLYGTVYATCALAISVSFFMYNSVFAKVMLFFWSVLLMGLAIINNTRIASRGWMQLVEALRQILMTPFERIGNTFASLFQDKGSESKKKAKGILIGVVCALPGLFIIIPILCQSDAAFEAVINSIFADGLARVIISVLLGSVIAALCFTSVFAATKNIVKIDQPNQPEHTEFKGVASTPVTAFLAMISSVYVVYLFSQLAYFFSAFSGFLPENYSTAQYARRGFFEMSIICAINVVIIALSLLICKRDEKGQKPLIVRLFCAFICLFSLVIVATVIGKLVMYMGNYGLTQKRVYTSLFCICAAVVIIFVGIRLFVRRFAYFRAAVATLAVMSIIIAFADVNTTVARYNTEAYLSGYLYEIDVDYLEQLDSSAVPYLVKLLECDDQQVVKQAATKLYRYAEKYGDIKRDSYLKFNNGVYSSAGSGDYYFEPDREDDFREFNLEHARARTIIADNWETIVKAYTTHPAV